MPISGGIVNKLQYKYMKEYNTAIKIRSIIDGIKNVHENDKLLI